MDKKEHLNIASVEGIAVADEHVVNANPFVQTLEVIAPSDLKEGYQFEVISKGQRFVVTVPPDGVSQGQQFSAQGCVAVSMSTRPRRWKTGLFDCFRHGICHPHFCLLLWCTGIALAQVMTRMRLTWLGGPGSIQQVASTFKTVAGLYIVFCVLYYWLQVSASILSYSGDSTYYGDDAQQSNQQESLQNVEIVNIIISVCQMMEFIFAVYFVVTRARARMAVCHQNNIPEESCRGCEDCCCACFCQMCVVAQMLRKTTDYDEFPASLCTETGLPPHVNVV